MNLLDQNFLNVILSLKGWSLSKPISNFKNLNELVRVVDHQNIDTIMTLKEIKESFDNLKFKNGYARAQYRDILDFCNQHNFKAWSYFDKYVIFNRADNTTILLQPEQLKSKDFNNVSNENKQKYIADIFDDGIQFISNKHGTITATGLLTSFDYLYLQSRQLNTSFKRLVSKLKSRKKLNEEQLNSLLSKEIDLIHFDIGQSLFIDSQCIHIPFKNGILDYQNAFKHIVDSPQSYHSLKSESSDVSQLSVNIMENYIKYILEQLLEIKFVQNERTFLSPEKTGRNLSLELDGLAMKDKIAFEYQGHPSHWNNEHPDYNDCKEKEQIKIKVCHENYIQLLIVPELKRGYRNFQFIVNSLKKLMNDNGIDFKDKDVSAPSFFKISQKTLESLEPLCNRYNIGIHLQDDTGVTFKIENFKTPFFIKKSWTELRDAIDNNKIDKLFNTASLTRASILAWHIQEMQLIKKKQIVDVIFDKKLPILNDSKNKAVQKEFELTFSPCT